MKIEMKIVLEFDQDFMYDKMDRFQVDWFFNEVLSCGNNNLILISNELGDNVGEIIESEYIREIK